MRGAAYRSGVLAAVLGGLLLGGGLVAAAVGVGAASTVTAQPHARLLVGLGLATAGVGLAIVAGGLALILVVRRRAPDAVSAPAGTPDRPLHGMVLAASLLDAGLLVAMLLLPPVVVAPAEPAGEGSVVETATLSGTAQGAGSASAFVVQPSVHEVASRVSHGVVRGSLNWTPGAASPPSLVLVLEVAEGDGWREAARGEGGPGLLVESAPVETGGIVRARVLVGGPAGVGSQDYSLTLTALAVERPSRDAPGE